MSLRIWLPVASVLTMVVAASVAQAGGGGPAEPRDTVGVVRGLGSTDPVWYLRSSNDPLCTTPVVTQLGFGASTDQPLTIDSDGDGLDQVAVFRDEGGNGFFYIRDSNTPGAATVAIQAFGAGTDIGLAGNFDPSTPEDELGVFRPSTNEFFLDDGNPAPLTFIFGDSGDIPLVGNWDASSDGSDEVGLYRPSNNTFYLRADNIPGASAVTVRPMGDTNDLPVVGDWDRDGSTTIGVFRDLGFGLFFLSDQTTGGVATTVVGLGDGSDTPITGDWDGPTVDEAGCP